MSCLWCLKHCVRIDDDDDDNEKAKREPLIDLVKLIEELAWQRLCRDPPDALTLGERLCGLKKVVSLEVDKTFISVAHADTLTLIPKAKGPEESVADVETTVDEDAGTPGVALAAPVSQPQGTTFLFQSQFHNDTQSRQTYNFKTERQTRSAMEVSLQRGFTLGQSLEIDVKIPTGVKGCKVSGKLGGQMQWSFTRGKVSRQEEQVTWSVDSHVEVAANTTGVATLGVQETRWAADFTLNCVIHPRPTIQEAAGDDSDSEDAGPTAFKFPVFVRRRATGRLIEIINIPRSIIIKARPEHFKAYKHDKSGILCTLQGECQSVCAINQRVWLKEAKLVPGSRPDGILHQDSVIIGSV